MQQPRLYQENLTAGSDATVIHSFPDASGSMFDITTADHARETWRIPVESK